MVTLRRGTSANTRDSGDAVSIPGSGKSSEEENGNPFQYSCLEKSMERGTCQATVHGIAKSQIQLSDFTMQEKKKTVINRIKSKC